MTRQKLPDWMTVYQTQDPRTMPWFHEALDPDLFEALKPKATNLGFFLDLGTGPGTQAVALAKLGYKVTATDISPAAIEQAKQLSSDVEFLVDDVLDTKIDREFDYVFDRGCFHVLHPEQRPTYVETLSRLVSTGGTFFLKCFSIEDPPREVGPYRYSEESLRETFQSAFRIVSVKHTVYQGQRDPTPKALFAVLKPSR